MKKTIAINHTNTGGGIYYLQVFSEDNKYLWDNWTEGVGELLKIVDIAQHNYPDAVFETWQRPAPSLFKVDKVDPVLAEEIERLQDMHANIIADYTKRLANQVNETLVKLCAARGVSVDDISSGRNKLTYKPHPTDFLQEDYLLDGVPLMTLTRSFGVVTDDIERKSEFKISITTY